MSKKNPEEQLAELQAIEEENLLIAQQNETAYTKKVYEILEWEVREVIENEGIFVRENPLDFPASVQRKYFWESAEDWKAPIDWNANDKNQEIPTWFFQISETIQNPYTKEYISFVYLREIPKPTLTQVKDQIVAWTLTERPEIEIPSKDIGEIIIDKNFDGNINAQLAALSKSNIKMLAILANVVWKPTIKAVFAEEIALASSISDTRVLCGLSAFDLSFLD